MEILFVSDYVCPYCLVAKEALRRALEKLGVEAKITEQPFELTPEPREPTAMWCLSSAMLPWRKFLP